jgi:hypothetical protein
MRVLLWGCRGSAGGTGVWGAWRGFGLGVAVPCVLLRAYQIKRLCVYACVVSRLPRAEQA